jgi:hypothetical protein
MKTVVVTFNSNYNAYDFWFSIRRKISAKVHNLEVWIEIPNEDLKTEKYFKLLANKSKGIKKIT